MKFIDKVTRRLDLVNTRLCVGLDSRYDRIPPQIASGQSISDAIFAFNKQIIDVTGDLAVAYKSNVAFYAGFGAEGLEGLRRTNEYLAKFLPEIPRLADCKRSEMGESVKMIQGELFDWLSFDCVMVTPWFGFDTVRDYLSDERHGVAVYAHDSNPSAGEFQDLNVVIPGQDETIPLYQYVASRVATVWNTNGNVFVEAGLTYPETLPAIRKAVGEEMPMLIAGMGAQGGQPSGLKGIFGRNKSRLFVNASRAVIFPVVRVGNYFDGVRESALNIINEISAVAKL